MEKNPVILHCNRHENTIVLMREQNNCRAQKFLSQLFHLNYINIGRKR